jgi:hypothetical protein
VVGSGDNLQVRPVGEGVHFVFQSGIWDQPVFVTYDEKLGPFVAFYLSMVKGSEGRGYESERLSSFIPGNAIKYHRGPEGVPHQPKSAFIRVRPVAQQTQSCAHVFSLPLALGERPLTIPYPTKIESEGPETFPDKGAAHFLHKSIIHVPAEDWMGMTDYHPGKRSGESSREGYYPF